MSMPIEAALQKVAAARRAYFEQGIEPDSGLIDQAIYRSWSRCVAARRREQESVAFDPVGRSRLSELMDRNEALLRAAKEPLANLSKAVAGAGYAVLLTDSRGYALSVAGALDQREQAVRLAFRRGVDLSERTIGTSAMSCALSERRAVRVFGPEHFFSANQLFHCAAAPIVDPAGEVIGVVDITRDSPQPDFGALSLVNQCAQAVERELFGQLNAYLTLNLSWQVASPHSPQDLLLAFGADGEIIAFNESARRFMGATTGEGALRFEDIFEGRFSENAGSLRSAVEPVPLRLRSGLCLFASGQPASVASSPRGAGRLGNEVAKRGVVPEFGDPAVERHIDIGLKALANGLPLLIQGETGSGKEVVANTLHARSGRGSGPFIAINCAAIPESLIEGELFGHEEGAYTGARRGGAPGKIEQAHGGTLFLDEIGDMPAHLQARLLRVLETREVNRLGTAAVRKVDFQLICATHQDIAAAVREGRFRQDLYYRLNGYVVSLSPLRVRPDLPALAWTMLNEISKGTRRLTTAAVDALQRYPWPGNARELKHALTYAHAVADHGVCLEPGHLPETVLAGASSPACATGLLPSLEDRAIEDALRQTGGHVPQAARLLGMGRATLYRRLRKRGQ